MWWKENLVKHQKVSKYYETDCRFRGVCSRYNLPKIKDGAYIVNLDECEWVGSNWIALYINGDKVHTLIVLGLNKSQNKFKNL